MTKVKVIEVEGMKLDPKAKYLILADNHAMSLEEMSHLSRKLKAMDIQAHIQPINDIASLKVYEVMASE